MSWQTEIGPAFLISSSFMGIFGTSELLRGFDACSQEMTRKFVHLSAGLVSLSFAYIFKSHWTLLVMCAGFLGIIKITKRFDMLVSVTGITRKSSGDYLHPIAIYVVFLITFFLQKPHFYVISILVLSVSDALAALIGKSYGFRVFEIEEERKSIEGSLIFFLSAFLITHLGMLLLSEMGRQECVITGLVVSILVTSFEALSLGGADNFFIPLGTLYILHKFETYTINLMIYKFCILGMVFALAALLASKSRQLDTSGAIGIGLISYAAWSLADFEWYIPILIMTVLLARCDFFLEIPGSHEALHRIRPIFYIFIISFVWVLGANRLPQDMHLFAPAYLQTLMASLCIMWGWHCRAIEIGSVKGPPGFFDNANFLARTAFLVLVFLPFPLLGTFGKHPLHSGVLCLGGTILADRLYWGIGNRFHGKWRRIHFIRMGTVILLVTSSLVFGGCLWLDLHL